MQIETNWSRAIEAPVAIQAIYRLQESAQTSGNSNSEYFAAHAAGRGNYGSHIPGLVLESAGSNQLSAGQGAELKDAARRDDDSIEQQEREFLEQIPKEISPTPTHDPTKDVKFEARPEQNSV